MFRTGIALEDGGGGGRLVINGVFSFSVSLPSIVIPICLNRFIHSGSSFPLLLDAGTTFGNAEEEPVKDGRRPP